MTLFALTFILTALSSASNGPQTVSPPDSVVIRRILDSARALHLPEAPLRSVLQEGKQRNESSARIVSALRSYFETLQKSRSALGTRATDAEIDAGASVLLSGAETRTLTAVRAARPDGNLTVALVVLADLIDRGVPLSRAEDAVVTLARVGASDAAFHDFRVGVQQDLAAGQGAESSLLKRTRETVSRLQVLPVRKQQSAPLLDARMFTTGSNTTSVQESNALVAAPLAQQRAFWDVTGRGAPIARWPALQLRGAAAGTFDRTSESGQTSAELLVSLAKQRANVGAEIGVGGAAYSGLAPRLPVGYASTWFTRAATHLRVEGRFAAARTIGNGSRYPTRDINRLEAIAFQTDTMPGGGGNPPPPPSPDTLTPDSSSRAPDRVSEVRLGLSQGLGRLTFEAASGVRFLDAKPLDTWNTLSVTAPLSSRLGLLAGVASRRAILEGAAPSNSHVFLGVRLRTWPRFEPEPRPIATPKEDASAPRASVRREGATLHFSVVATGASRVEVSGDFTEWKAIEMTRAERGRWTIPLPAGAALVRLRIRVDGLAWTVPAGVARSRNAFGDEVGIVLVEARAGS